jgi:hypothetical protein
MRRPTEKEAHNEEAVVDCCGIEEGKEEGAMFGGYGSQRPNEKRMRRPTGEKEAEEADMGRGGDRQRRTKPTMKRKLLTVMALKRERRKKLAWLMVNGCGSVEVDEADKERTTRPTGNEEGKEEECECVEMPKSPPRQNREPAAENFFI